MPEPRSLTSGTPAERASLASSLRRDLLGKALDAIVRGVDLEDERAISGVECGLVVLSMGAVGGADLDQARPRPRHDIRHAEGAADLDQFAARDDRPAAVARERVERQQHRGGVVVDQCRVLARRSARRQARADDRRARRACRWKGRIRARRRCAWPRPQPRSAASARSARPRLVWSTVPVRLKTGRSELADAASSAVSASAPTPSASRSGALPAGGVALRFEQFAHAARRLGPAETLDRGLRRRRPQHGVDRRDRAKARVHRISSPAGRG